VGLWFTPQARRFCTPNPRLPSRTCVSCSQRTGKPKFCQTFLAIYGLGEYNWGENMSITRRGWLKSLAVAPVIGTAIASLLESRADEKWRPRDTSPLHPDSLFRRQHLAIASEWPLVLITGARGTGKSWVLQRIAEKEQRRFRQVGVASGLLHMEPWSCELDPTGPLLSAINPGPDLRIGFPSPEVLLVDNAENFPENEFGDLMYATRRACRSWSDIPRRIVVASAPCVRTREILIESGIFEVHHLGSMWDNPYLRT